MTRLVQSPRFRRDIKRFGKSNPKLKKSIQRAMDQMLIDPFAPFLYTHKLGGTMQGLLACSCGFDCRIVFTITKDQSTGDEVILLSGIGTHEEVY